jgi:nuclear transport factor 2 (NTF2) superfamily protein
MTMQEIAAETDRNPRTYEEARSFVRQVESLFMPWNIEALVAGFTEDCKVRFGTVELSGRRALREFFEARSKRQNNYRLRKELRSFAGDMLANVWEGQWEDAETAARMRGFGVEIWVMRGGKIAAWEAAFNVVAADRSGGVEQMLRS